MAQQYFGLLDLGTPQLLLILLIVLLFFGAKKLPDLSRSIGSSMRELRKGMGLGVLDLRARPGATKRRRGERRVGYLRMTNASPDMVRIAAAISSGIATACAFL